MAEEGSRFSLIEEYVSGSPDLAAYSNAAVELFVEQGAKLEYVSLQNYSAETWHFATHHARVERDAELDWVAGGFGSRRGKVRIQNDLAGPGATSRVTGAYFADGTQHLDYDTFQEHIAPNTTSDFAFKGALRDEASVVWRGMIRVEKDAQKTNAYQENRNLLLSEQAHADSIPGLEILANDVRCTHGATLSQVDRDQLFYAMARGLTRADAERLIVRGFFQDMLDRIELAPVREALAEALEARIPQGYARPDLVALPIAGACPYPAYRTAAPWRQARRYRGGVTAAQAARRPASYGWRAPRIVPIPVVAARAVASGRELAQLGRLPAAGEVVAVVARGAVDALAGHVARAAQRASVCCGWYCVEPEASRPNDWKHVATQPGSLRRHQAATLVQL